MSPTHHVGQRLSFDGTICTVRYIGEVTGTTGTWLGVEWDAQHRGKHDGSHKGVRYFTCVSRSPTAASFVRPTRRADTPQSFIAALHEKYASDNHPDTQIYFSGKIAEEVGFDKIRRKQAQLHDLEVVILDGLRVATARQGDERSVRETCPSITHLDISRNLFETLGPVVDVCRDLDNLRRLSINGNRFHGVLSDEALLDCDSALKGIQELSLGDTLLDWTELCHIAGKCASLTSLAAGSNYLSALPPVDYSTLTTTLTTLNLEFNDFTTLADLSSLTELTALRSLILKGNRITDMAPPGTSAPIFPPSVYYLDVSYNEIKDWSFVDRLPSHFAGLSGLRLTHNPVYEPTIDADAKASSSEDAHMLTIARIASLRSLNFTTISASDRANAEMFYLSRIAKQLASVPEAAEEGVKAQHPRYAELSDIYGEPDIIRREEVNPSFLEARLVTVGFHCPGKGRKTTRIPRSFDVYSVKGIAGKLFGLPPLGLRLVWETGEWDPVAGFYDMDGDSSSEDDELDVEEVPEEIKQGANEDTDGGKPGRWVKREVELKDGPRQLGYCVDGLDATIRVEER